MLASRQADLRVGALGEGRGGIKVARRRLGSNTPSGWSAAEAAEEERKTANGSTSLVAEPTKCSRSASTTSEGDCGSVVSVLALCCHSRW